MSFARGMLDTLTRRRRPSVDDGAVAPEPQRILIDGSTRTFWARGAAHPATLVETEADPTARPARVASLIAAHDSGRPSDSRPAGNPAFSEALFVELMRAQQFSRAYALLTPDCQRRWTNAERFADAHRDNALCNLRGVNVLEARYLEDWMDPELQTRHDAVAELDVEYTFAQGSELATVRRTVHLVGIDGKWKSLSYPR
ncbi:MAG: hypothetical protein ACR2GX_07955 [Candidatus Dormibacteria bacterium]